MTEGFGPANLPFGVVAPRDGGAPRCAVRFGDQVVDLAAAHEQGLLGEQVAEIGGKTRHRFPRLRGGAQPYSLAGPPP